MTVTVDTNIVVYTFDLDAGRKHDEAVRLMARLRRGEGVLTIQVLGEFFHVMSRKFRMPPAILRQHIADLRLAFPVIAADGSALDAAIRAVEAHNLSFWDAMLWATAKAGGCRVLLSEDLQNGRKLGGVNIVNPFDPENERLLDVILPEVDEAGY